MVLGPLVSAYSRSLAVAPLPTKSLLAAVIAIGSDAVAQLSDGGGAGEAKGLDVERAVAFGIFGASYTGAFQHHLFDWLSSNCHGHTLARLCSASPAAEWVGWLGAAMERTLLNQ